ncbi:aldose epimerase family protein [uncultured Pelagimonas sp.]|uniref:aldose epimerase family protein n=1 Tax=uncultured Pelagimonas sp. TaxID=1618102 RepID=UPI00260B4B14|nr:aldose epimerase family protein [uncultured Pelagimonas sp.]
MTDKIQTAVLENEIARITVLSIGCSIQDWRVHGRPVVLGYADVEAYRTNPCVMGSIVGRIANRTAGASFELDGKRWPLPANDGPNHIHGGPGGLAWQNWTLHQNSATSVALTLRSEHLDQGYPGCVDFEVQLTLDGTALTWVMTGKPDRETPINLAQHVYFNLAGTGNVLDHKVQIGANYVTPTDQALIPTGEKLQVGNSRFDFRHVQTLSEADPENLGYDLNFVLDKSNSPSAQVSSPDGMTLKLWTDQPGLQFYTAKHLSRRGVPIQGANHDPDCGFCLEAQSFPNSINQPGFGSIVYSPDNPYLQRTTIEIAPTD